jgi:predicted nucleic acid-binding protein
VTLILDTNVLSTLMRAEPDPALMGWIAAQPGDQLCTTTLTQAEVMAGLAIMPEGQRRTKLIETATAMFAEDFAGRLLPFDSAAATAYASIFAARRRAGRPTATIDLMIAAIAQCRTASVVTRNGRDFEGFGVTVIDPWAR